MIVIFIEAAFTSITSARLIQDIKVFSELPVNVKGSLLVARSLLFLIFRGAGEIEGQTTLSRQQSTDVFFALTKTFQFRDPLLKKIALLGLREIAPASDDTIMIISSLTQDIGASVRVEACIRALAMRALGTVTDVNC